MAADTRHRQITACGVGYTAGPFTRSERNWPIRLSSSFLLLRTLLTPQPLSRLRSATLRLPLLAKKRPTKVLRQSILDSHEQVRISAASDVHPLCVPTPK
jgi:hypothetical protein